MTDDKRSPLHDWHEANGAETIWEDGYPWTMHEGRDPMQEYEAVRTGTGIWDLFSTCKYEVTGPDAARLIQRRFTNTLAGMEPGQVRYGAFVNADGMMIDDGNVYRFADDRFWMMINSAGIEDWFRETATGLDATVAHRTDELAMIAVQGPTSQATLQGITGRDLGELRYFRFWPEPTTVAGVSATVTRTGFSGEHGYEVIMAPRGRADRLGRAPCRRGNAVRSVGDRPGADRGRARDHRGRLRPGRAVPVGPLDGSVHQDATRRTSGAEALAARGANPPKRFKTLRVEGDAVPEAGAQVTKDGRPVGTVTSPAASPRVGTIGLAILDADVAGDGEKVDVAVGDGTAAATVAPLSILDPKKERPRS